MTSEQQANVPDLRADVAISNLYLDEITGEKVSKTELKKRQKLRQKQKEKDQREIASPKPASSKSRCVEDDEKKLNPNVRFI